jgi:hypothetical protein
LPSRSRRSDIKVIVAATFGVLLVGFFIAGAALVATRGADSTVCGRLNVGAAADIRHKLTGGGPSFHTGGASCGFWLDLSEGDIVAYRAKQPRDCTLKFERDHWNCDGPVDVVDLAQFPVTIERIDELDAVIVDLRPPSIATTTSRA